ncbi:MAG: hypothetical protein ABF330_11585 [Lentimonas sp.]
MSYLFIKFSITVGLLFVGTSLFADRVLKSLTYYEKDMNVLIRQTPMPEMGESRLEKILTRYYEQGLGGLENWEKIESLKVSGSLKTTELTYKLAACQKKPHFVKLTLRTGKSHLTLGYDGKDAWNILSESGGKATKMDEAVARRFIHNSHFGNHLLYPYKLGKTVSYVDTIPVEGNICHLVRVVLDTDYQIDYFIDIRSYLEVKVEHTDLRNKSVNTTVYTDYIRELGMPIAKNVISRENGEFVSEIQLDEVTINSGIMPWMFRMPK